jgi:hypothetical protein
MLASAGGNDKQVAQLKSSNERATLSGVALAAYTPESVASGEQPNQSTLPLSAGD